MDEKPDTYHSALEEVDLQTRYQRCWVHKKGNVLNCFLKLTQPRIKQSLHDIWQAKTHEDADRAFDLFILTYEDKYPKATLMLQNGGNLHH